MATQEPKSDRCAAKTRGKGGYCEKYPIEGRARCRLHGGASTGPNDTEYLKDNSHAEGNSGGPPELNTNASKSGTWCDWEKAYKRFDDETRAYVGRLIESLREATQASEVDSDRREELLKEYATRSILHRRASYDIILNTEGGEIASALKASNQHSARQRAIANELDLWPQNSL